MLRIAVLILLTSLATAAATAQETVDWRTKRIVLHRSFADELQQIGNWCRENRLPNQVGQTFKLYRKRDPSRQYIFLPTEKTMPTPPAGPLGQWLGKINGARRTHAAKVFSLAAEAADAGAGGIAFQLLHEVIHFDRDHEQARRILHHKRVGDVWELWPEKTRTTVSRKPHDVMGWAGGSWSITRTPHFEIDSMVGETATSRLPSNWNAGITSGGRCFSSIGATPTPSKMDRRQRFVAHAVAEISCRTIRQPAGLRLANAGAGSGR